MLSFLPPLTPAAASQTTLRQPLLNVGEEEEEGEEEEREENFDVEM